MLRVGVIGTGVMGANHARIFSLMKNVEFVGLTDLDARKAADIASRFTTKAYQDDRSLIEDCDAVTIAAVTPAHYALARDAIEADCDVLIEKPITETVEQADELISLAASSGRILMAGHVERFNPAIIELAEIVDTPVHMEARRFSPYDKRISSGVVLDLMVHDLDIVMDLAGAPIDKVTSMCVDVKPESATEDLAHALIRFKNGVTASLIASRVHQNKVRQLNVAQKESYVTVDYMKQELVINRYVSADMVMEGEVKYRQEVITEIPYLRTRGEPLWIELEHFVDCVDTRRKPAVSGEQGRDVLAAALAITQANFLQTRYEDSRLKGGTA